MARPNGRCAVTAEIGLLLFVLGLVASGAQAVLGLRAGQRTEMAAASAAAAQVCAAAFAAAFALLIVCFARSDFSLAAVAANSHSAKPLVYKIAATWGHHEGSMALWCVISSVAGLALAGFRGGLASPLWSAALGVQGLVTLGAAAYTAALSNPFARLATPPIEGAGLNPLLQDPALVLHPPMLYLGYVGLSVPFSLAVAALWTRSFGPELAQAIRPWALLAWSALTVGIGLGSYWAYYELGWGGAWFWDPVENASFLPWLIGTALLHSAIVTARRGSMMGWTLLLAIAGFACSLLGTFLVRSGVLSSVHAFAVDPSRGVAVLALFACAVGGALTLFAWRAPHLPAPSGFVALSREGALAFNNFGVAICAGVVLIGTLYPLAAEAVSGRALSVGAPFFNATFGPLAGLILLAAPFGPLLAWRRGDLRAAWRSLVWAGIGALLAVGVGLAYRGGVAAALGLGIGAWMALGALTYLWRRAGAGPGRAARVLAAPLAVWALAAAHFGAGVLTIGAVAQASFRFERSASLAPGDRVTFAGREVRLVRVEDFEGPNYEAQRAVFAVRRGERDVPLQAERRRYWTSSSPTTEVGILSGLWGDVYVAVGEPAPGAQGQIGVRLYFNPFIAWMFSGIGVIALGGGLALLSLARVRVRRQGAVPGPVAALP